MGLMQRAQICEAPIDEVINHGTAALAFHRHTPTDSGIWEVDGSGERELLLELTRIFAAEVGVSL